MATPLGNAGGVPDSANTDNVSTDVGMDARILVGSPQALITTTADNAARSARRAFIE
jgi:hypothetical protein